MIVQLRGVREVPNQQNSTKNVLSVIYSKLRKIASAQVRSLLLDGWRLVAQITDADSSIHIVLKHSNGRKCRLHLSNNRFSVYVNSKLVKSYPNEPEKVY